MPSDRLSFKGVHGNKFLKVLVPTGAEPATGSEVSPTRLLVLLQGVFPFKLVILAGSSAFLRECSDGVREGLSPSSAGPL